MEGGLALTLWRAGVGGAVGTAGPPNELMDMYMWREVGVLHTLMGATAIASLRCFIVDTLRLCHSTS